jgi:hypothetical protein
MRHRYMKVFIRSFLRLHVLGQADRSWFLAAMVVLLYQVSYKGVVGKFILE